MCLSNRSGSSSSSRLSTSIFLSLCSRARVQCAMMWTISAMKVSSGVILLYHACTKSRSMMAIMA